MINKSLRLFFLLVLALNVHSLLQAQDSIFIVKPYLQLGENPSFQSISIVWESKINNGEWKLEYKKTSTSPWNISSLNASELVVPNMNTRNVYQTVINDLTPGSTFQYRISVNNHIVFESDAKALKSIQQPYRIVAMGDIGAGSPEAKKIAYQVYKNNPDMVVIPGDIVYDRGTVSDYDRNFWPVYNRDQIDTFGAPLMRKIPFVAAPGNHDTEEKDLVKYPDAQAYFYFWNQPLNGISLGENSPAFQQLNMSSDARATLLKSAGKKFPTMANFSFDFANSHWLTLDANGYVDWTNKNMIDWVVRDLEKASTATWKFVLFHHPGFNSSIDHFEQQQMRLLSPIFEKYHVDVVFMGHVHNYQRSYPLTFKPDGMGTLLIGGRNNNTIRGRVVNGQWTLDKSFDGDKHTKPKGVVYIVTGAGGNDLYNPEQELDTDTWQKFTTKFKASHNSFSLIDVDGNTFKMKQISIDGKVLDQFVISK